MFSTQRAMSLPQIVVLYLATISLMLLVACGGRGVSATNGGSTGTNGGTSGESNSGGGSTGGTGSSNPGSGGGSQHATFVYSRISGSQIVGYKLNSGGTLTSLGGSPFAISGGSIAGSGTHLLVVNQGQVSSYGIDSQSGALTPQSQTAASGASYVAAQGSDVYVTGTNSAGDFVVYGFSVGQSGTLTAVSGSPFLLQQSCDLCAEPYGIRADAKYVVAYVGNGQFSSGGFTLYARQSDGSLAKASAFGANSILDVALAPSDQFLYAVDSGEDSILAMSIDSGGQMKEIQDFVPTVSSFAGVTVSNNGQYLLASDSPNSLIAYTLNSDGSVGSEASHIQTGGSSSPSATLGGVTLDPSGSYVVLQGQNDLEVYRFDQSSGSLTNGGRASTGSVPGRPVIVSF